MLADSARIRLAALKYPLIGFFRLYGLTLALVLWGGEGSFVLDGVRKGRWGRVGVGRGAARGVCAGTSGRKGLRF